MRIVLLGAPGSGKGTQAKKLVKSQRVPHISTGDLLREARENGTSYGAAAQDAMDAGHLVPDDIMLGIIKDRLTKPDIKRGFILDGFPRTVIQAEALDEMLDDMRRPLDGTLLLDVDKDLLIQRITGRRSCGRCGAVYNIFTTPPALEGQCDVCGSDLRHRPDDNDQAIENRLRSFESQTKPVITYYELQGTLYEVDATGEIDVVSRRLQTVIDVVKKNARKRGRPRKAAVKQLREAKANASQQSAAKATATAATKKTTKKAAKKVTKKAAKKKVAKKSVTKKKAKKKVAKKKVAKKKAAKKVAKRKTKKKVTKKKKVSRKKKSRATKKRQTKKKVTKRQAKKRTTKRKTKKKVTKRKTKKRTTKKRATKKRTTKRKAAKKKTTKRRATKKKTIRRKTTKKKSTRRKTRKKRR
ncbi:MAG: adenylate kinase [Gammaproteobacteria bacterium]|nr:adenylate kinase [Gammaproteobacteria bacterium]